MGRGWRGRKDYEAAKQAKAKSEAKTCWRGMKQFYDAHEWEVREHGHNSAWGRALPTSPSEPIRLVSKKAKQATDAICEQAHRESIAATRIQSRWRGVLGRDNYQAAAKATLVRGFIELALKAAQAMGWAVHGYQSEVTRGELCLVVFAEPLESGGGRLARVCRQARAWRDRRRRRRVASERQARRMWESVVRMNDGVGR